MPAMLGWLWLRWSVRRPRGTQAQCNDAASRDGPGLGCVEWRISAGRGPSVVWYVVFT